MRSGPHADDAAEARDAAPCADAAAGADEQAQEQQRQRRRQRPLIALDIDALLPRGEIVLEQGRERCLVDAVESLALARPSGA